MQVPSLGWEDPLEEGMVTHSSVLAWRIPWTKEPGRLQSMGSLRVRHDWETSLSLFTFMHWRRKWHSSVLVWHSSVLVWRIPGTAEPGGLPLMESHRVRHNWTDLAYIFLGQKDTQKNGMLPTPVFLGFPGDSDGKETTCNAGDVGFHPGLWRSLCWEDPLEKGTANYSGILAMVRGAC